MSFDWKSVLRAVAPTLGGLIDGPVGSTAFRTVADTLLGDKGSDANEQLVADAMAKATPDDLLKLKVADQEFAEQMAKLNSDYTSLFIADTANARAREVTTKDWVVKALAVSITIIFAIVLAGLFLWSIPSGNQNQINILFGTLQSAWLLVVGYYFGSSAGSAKKDETIQTAMSKN